MLRQGRDTVDVGVYYEDLGLAGASAGTQQPVKHMLGTDSATSTAGYTYDYINPAFLAEPGIVDPDGGLFGGRTDQEALVLNNQTTMSVANARQLLALAKQGLRLFVVGEAPSTTTGAEPDGDQLDGVVDELLAQPSVIRVAEEAALPAALAAAGIRPTAAPEKSGKDAGPRPSRSRRRELRLHLQPVRRGRPRQRHPGRIRHAVPAQHLDRQDRAHRRVHDR